MSIDRYILILLLTLLSAPVFAQEELDEKKVQASNDLIHEGNNLVESDFISAEKEYRKAISKAPNNAVGSYNLAHAYYNSGHLDEALYRNLETAKNSQSKTERHAAFHNIGNILMEREQCEEAIDAFKNALRNDPTDDETRYNLALAKECAKNQGGGDGQDENSDEKNEDENKQSENNNNENQKDQGDQNEEDDSEGDDKQDQSEGDDQQDDNGNPTDEKDNNEKNKPGDQKQQQQQAQPGKLSPQQVRNLLEAMNNQEKKVQDKINAQKVKGVKVKTEKDW